MISFYPGPSRTYDEIPRYVNDAHKLGIMSMNHRSEEFVEISKKTIALLKQKLGIPKNYTVLYASSATECWEIISQSLIREKSYHIYNGSFGEKWFEYTKKLRRGAVPMPFNQEAKLNPDSLTFGNDGVICITQNETSNGTQISNAIISKLKKNNPEHLIAVDATSSMGGMKLDFKNADIWFASVQKCIGLPAGLALMICSPNAVNEAKLIKDRTHYNSLPFMFDMMDKWQTPYTPNVLGIYLLMRVMEKALSITQVDREIKRRFEDWNNFFNQSNTITLLIKNNAVRSYTVIAIEGSPERIKEVKSLAKEKNILLGEGYGDLKKNTFRIANFPAIKKNEIAVLMKFLKSMIK